MNTATRASFCLVATALLAAAAVLIGKQFEAESQLEPLVPCVLSLLGAGLFGLGLFAPATAQEDCQIHGEAGSEGVELGDGGLD